MPRGERNSAFFQQASRGAGGEAPLIGSRGTAARKKAARTSGVLDLTECGLSSVDRELLDLRTDVGGDGNWWEVVGLREVKLSDNEIAEITADAWSAETETLQVVTASNNRLGSVPEGLGEAKGLKKLVLSKNPIVTAPDCSCWPELVVLDLSYTNLMELPHALDKLMNLNILDVSHCKINNVTVQFPRQLEKLLLSNNKISHIDNASLELLQDSLVTLDLSKNALCQLPTTFSHLRRLQLIDLSYNQFERLGTQIPQAERLDQLLLGYNRLVSLNELGLGQRTPNLSVLGVNDNKLGELPEDMLVQLMELKSLDCSNNNLADLPSVLGYMEKLQGINVLGNPLRGIRYSVLQAGGDKLKALLKTRGERPEVLQTPVKSSASLNLTRLQMMARDNVLLRDALAAAATTYTLDLSRLAGIDLGIIWEECELDHDLQSLVLAQCELGAIPRFSGCAMNLVTLDLSGNLLREVPGVVLQNLPRLEALNLRNNQIESFAEDLMTSERGIDFGLRRLDLCQNSLRKIPSAIGLYFRHLEELLISFNPITQDDPTLSNLEQLCTFDISNCQLTTFPSAVLVLQYIDYVNVEFNSISTIPMQVALKPNLKTLLIQGNPQRAIRPSIIAGGSTAVLAYMRDRCEVPTPQAEPAEDTSDLQQKIQEISERLENDFSLSNTMKMQLKRDLARARAALP